MQLYRKTVGMSLGGLGNGGVGIHRLNFVVVTGNSGSAIVNLIFFDRLNMTRRHFTRFGRIFLNQTLSLLELIDIFRLLLGVFGSTLGSFIGSEVYV